MSQNRQLLIFICLSILNFSSVSAINAQTLVRNPTKTTYQITPFSLIVLARNGYFRQQGIPSYSSLIAAYNLGRVTALDIVRAAVQANRLSPEYLSDRSFLKAVNAQSEILLKIY